MTNRIIAIGDVHGCSKALTTIIEAVRPTQRDALVFLGDYIDRGPDSRGVIDLVIALRERCHVIPLLGNHEEMLLGVLEGGQSELQFWLKFGGTEALASYGWRGGPYLRPADVRSLIPAEHVKFLKGCREYFETVSHFFVHAYYDPELPLSQQRSSALRWGSLPAVPVGHCSSKIAIVGHTPQTNGEILDFGYFKCIDTFCHGDGWLTALDVETGSVWQANEKGELRVN